MSVMNAEIALGFVAKDMDLLFLALLDNGSINLCASNERLTNKSLVAFLPPVKMIAYISLFLISFSGLARPILRLAIMVPIKGLKPFLSGCSPKEHTTY